MKCQFAAAPRELRSFLSSNATFSGGLSVRLVLVAILAALNATNGSAETGVTETEIHIGSTGALSGPSKQYGEEMAIGEKAFFEKFNADGGVHGRKVRFTTLDDHYEPKSALDNAKKLVESEKIFAFLGGNGTPTMKLVLPVMAEAKIPLLFPYSGAEFLRVPLNPTVFNLRVSYDEENADLVDYVVGKLDQKSIGVVYQDDALGTTGRDGVQKALKKHQLQIEQSAHYTRNMEDIDKSVEAMVAAKPKVIFLEGTSNPLATFVKKCAEKGYKPIFAGPSPLGSFVMSDLLGSTQYQMYLSEVLPLPTDTSVSLVKEYQQAMKASGTTKFTFISLEGYAGAKVFAESLKRAGRELTREKLVSALESVKSHDLGGVKVNFGVDRHQGLNAAFVHKVENGKISSVSLN